MHLVCKIRRQQIMLLGKGIADANCTKQLIKRIDASNIGIKAKRQTIDADKTVQRSNRKERENI